MSINFGYLNKKFYIGFAYSLFYYGTADIKKILYCLHCLKKEGEREKKRQVSLTSSFFAAYHKSRVALCAGWYH